jgi:hypothetical protein
MPIDERMRPSSSGRDYEHSQARSAMGCHAERSEASDASATEMLRCAQHDTP